MIKVSQYVENQVFVTILQLLFIFIHDKILYMIKYYIIIVIISIIMANLDFF